MASAPAPIASQNCHFQEATPAQGTSMRSDQKNIYQRIQDLVGLLDDGDDKSSNPLFSDVKALNSILKTARQGMVAFLQIATNQASTKRSFIELSQTLHEPGERLSLLADELDAVVELLAHGFASQSESNIDAIPLSERQIIEATHELKVVLKTTAGAIKAILNPPELNLAACFSKEELVDLTNDDCDWAVLDRLLKRRETSAAFRIDLNQIFARYTSLQLFKGEQLETQKLEHYVEASKEVTKKLKELKQNLSRYNDLLMTDEFVVETEIDKSSDTELDLEINTAKQKLAQALTVAWKSELLTLAHEQKKFEALACFQIFVSQILEYISLGHALHTEAAYQAPISSQALSHVELKLVGIDEELSHLSGHSTEEGEGWDGTHFEKAYHKSREAIQTLVDGKFPEIQNWIKEKVEIAEMDVQLIALAFKQSGACQALQDELIAKLYSLWQKTVQAREATLEELQRFMPQDLPEAPKVPEADITPQPTQSPYSLYGLANAATSLVGQYVPWKK